MIRTLRVSNLAIIDELELELDSGLNVVTGETGAGKSILLAAVQMLSGRRVSSEVVRAGEESAQVEAIFESPELVERAVQLGLARDGDENLLVARSVSREGRGRVFVNGRLCTVALLSRLLADAIEVVSQGEHQRLLRPEVQTQLIDAYGDLEDPARRVRELFAAWRELARELGERRSNAGELARREDQLRYAIEQIEAVSPRSGELDSLDREHARLAQVDRLGERASGVLEALARDGGIQEQLAAGLAQIESILEFDSELSSIAEGLKRAAVEAAEAGSALESYCSSLEADPARLSQLESRLAELARLQSRYGATVEEILDYAGRAQAELERIGGGESRLAELELELVAASAELGASATDLSAARQVAGRSLARAVGKELSGLGLEKSVFQVDFEPVHGAEAGGVEPPSGPGGLERASFILTANPGEEARRLRDAVSGGELARLLLALRNALRDADRGRILVFDEVDAGIGGRVAHRVGERLRSSARGHQVLCITHMPQIAAIGTTHYLVEKSVRAGRTRTSVRPIVGDARVDEIARMAGDGRPTDASRAHARELLSR